MRTLASLLALLSLSQQPPPCNPLLISPLPASRPTSSNTRSHHSSINILSLHHSSPNNYFQPEPKWRQLPPAPPFEPQRPRPLTKIQTRPVPSIPARPKVVIFGAASSLGRDIIRTLMESKVNVDIVAFVKDYHNDWIGSSQDELVLAGVMQRTGMGPSLEVVEGDLISLPNVSYALEWRGDSNTTRDEMEGWNEMNSLAVSQAISGCTAVISCLEPRRGTDFYTDYLRVPFLRIWRYDVSSWCFDEGHPYYVYLANQKILREAEMEQERRLVAIESERERLRLEEELEARYSSKEDEEDSSIQIARELTRKRARLSSIDTTYSTSQLFEDIISTNTSMPLKSAGVRDRIKFILISDVNVGKNPWRLGNVLTNVLGSTMMRYEDRIEKMLKKSSLLDTVTVRVGEIVKEERNFNTTSLQLSTSGVVPSPSVVGIEDVSELVAVTSLTKIHDARFSLLQRTDVGKA